MLNIERGAVPVVSEAGVIGVVAKLTLCVSQVLGRALPLSSSSPLLPFLVSQVPPPWEAKCDALNSDGWCFFHVCHVCFCKFLILSAKPTSKNSLIYHRKHNFKKFSPGVPVVMNPISLHEDLGSIPGLAQ